MDKDQKLLNWLYEELEKEKKRKLLKHAVILNQFEDIEINIKEDAAIKPQVIPSNNKRKRAGKNSVYIHGRNFPSVKKACEFYKMKYTTVMAKKNRNICLDDIFPKPIKTNETKIIRRH